jgi:hypothetical protein
MPSQRRDVREMTEAVVRNDSCNSHRRHCAHATGHTSVRRVSPRQSYRRGLVIVFITADAHHASFMLSSEASAGARQHYVLR